MKRYGFFCFHRIGGFAEFVVVKAPSDDEVRHMAADLLEARTSYACVEVYGSRALTPGSRHRISNRPDRRGVDDPASTYSAATLGLAASRRPSSFSYSTSSAGGRREPNVS
jgi:hypothetical protein